MNYKKKNSFILVIILLVSLILVSCGKEVEPVVEGNNNTGKLDLLNRPGSNNETSLDKTLWQDEDGLISITKKDNGDFFIHYNLEKWDEIHDYTGYVKDIFYDAFLIDREIPINYYEGKIVDIGIGNVGRILSAYDSDIDYPLILFLMDDGRVEWMMGEPPIFFDDSESPWIEEYFEIGVAPYTDLKLLKDIVGFSYEPMPKYPNTKALYAIDKNGIKHDGRLAVKYEGFVGGIYKHFIGDEEVDLVTLELSLDPDGSADYKIYDYFDGGIAFYEGTYEFDLVSEGDFYGLLKLDLSMVAFESYYDHFRAEDKINGSYMVDEIEYGGYLLTNYKGDVLSNFDDIYDFNLYYDDYYYDDYYDDYYDEPGFEGGFGSIWNLNDNEFMNYVLYWMPDIREMVRNYGMALIVEQSVTELSSEGVCRDISLGTNHGNQFVREYHYTVSSDGSIFMYDPINDYWTLEYSAGD